MPAEASYKGEPIFVFDARDATDMKILDRLYRGEYTIDTPAMVVDIARHCRVLVRAKLKPPKEICYICGVDNCFCMTGK